MSPLDGMTDNQRAEWGVARACELACLVREEGRDAITAWLDQWGADARGVITVALAAMVPVDNYSPAQLLGWLDGPPPVPQRKQHPRTYTDGRSLTPCGTHSAYARHKARGEVVDNVCLDAERAYQRNRPGRRAGDRAKRQEVAA